MASSSRSFLIVCGVVLACCLVLTEARAYALQVGRQWPQAADPEDITRPTLAKVVKALVKRTDGEEKRSYSGTLSCCYGDIFCVACDQIAIRSAEQTQML